MATSSIPSSLLLARGPASILRADTTNYVCQSCLRRGVATYRRTRKVLRVPGNGSNNNASAAPSETKDYIVFHPPSSAPNVYHTPAKFLPDTDRRKSLLLAARKPVNTPTTTSSTSLPSPLTTLGSIAARYQASNTSTSPPVAPRVKSYHLKQEQIDEIRALFTEDPYTWTRHRLAEKYSCSPFFVSLCVLGSKTPLTAEEMKAAAQAKIDEARSKWGPRKRAAREDRVERRKLWGLA